jgi:hypothetical protein
MGWGNLIPCLLGLFFRTTSGWGFIEILDILFIQVRDLYNYMDGFMDGRASGRGGLALTALLLPLNAHWINVSWTATYFWGGWKCFNCPLFIWKPEYLDWKGLDT